MRALLIVLVAVALPTCSSPTEDKAEEKDPRTSRTFDLYSLPGGRADGFPDSPRLWEGEDGASFHFRGGFLDCLTPPSAFEKYFWNLLEPENPETGMTHVRADGSVILQVTCELVGQDSILFRYPNTGETLGSNVWQDAGGCWHVTKQMPSEQTLSLGTVEGDEIPSYVVFPDTMPAGTFRDPWCDVQW